MKLVKWRKILREAQKRGRFNAFEVRRAGDWPTCAVGERHHAKGYTFLQQILPEENQLGYDFNDAVQTNDFDRVLHIIKKLEALPL